MAKKIIWVWTITKTSQKQSGYLLTGGTEYQSERNAEGQVVVDADDFTVWTSAWTTLGAAKRHAATSMDRSRVKWDEINLDAGEDRDLVWETRIESTMTAADMIDRNEP